MNRVDSGSGFTPDQLHSKEPNQTILLIFHNLSSYPESAFNRSRSTPVLPLRSSLCFGPPDANPNPGCAWFLCFVYSFPFHDVRPWCGYHDQKQVRSLFGRDKNTHKTRSKTTVWDDPAGRALTRENKSQHGVGWPKKDLDVGWPPEGRDRVWRLWHSSRLRLRLCLFLGPDKYKISQRFLFTGVVLWLS